MTSVRVKTHLEIFRYPKNVIQDFQKILLKNNLEQYLKIVFSTSLKQITNLGT